MATFNFTEVGKGKSFGGTIPDDVVRITAKYLTFGETVSKKFNSTRYKTAGGWDSVKLGIAYDLYNQAIKLSSDPEGFAVRLNENGTAIGSLPMRFRKAGLPVGDYKVVEGESNVFQLAR